LPVDQFHRWDSITYRFYLRVGLGADGRPDWASAKIDDQERERRLKAAQERLKRMSESDPGGDITI